MLLNLSLFVFGLLSNDEVVVTYYHDIIPKNIAPLPNCLITFVISSSIISKILKKIKGKQEQFRVFGYLYFYSSITVVTELNILLLASRVGSLLKFYLKFFTTSPMASLRVTASKVYLVVFPCSLHLIECAKASTTTL